MPTPFIQLQLRRGLKADLPILADGEIGFCTDTKEFFIGEGGVNTLLGYKPSTPGSWSGSPTTISEALDRIAAAVETLRGSPIP